MIKGIDSGAGISQAFPVTEKSGSKSSSPAEGFSQMLGDLVDKVNQSQLDADKSVQNLVTGESKGLHEVMIAMEKANISFQFITQVRNKAIDAYQEIMRMPV